MDTTGGIRFCYLACYLGVAMVIGGCCSIVGRPCANLEPSPSITWVNADGMPVSLIDNGITVLSLSNLAFEDDGNVVWEITPNYDPAFPNPDNFEFVLVTDAGEYGNLLSDGDARDNLLLVRYEYGSLTLADTLYYRSSRSEDRCCTALIMDPVADVRGPLVSGFERSTSFPGVVISLRDTL